MKNWRDLPPQIHGNLLVEYKSLTYRKLRIFVRSNLTSHFLATNCLSTASIQHTGRQVQLNGVLSPTSRTSAPPMDIQNAPPRAPRADIWHWRTATINIAHTRHFPVRLFGGKDRGWNSRLGDKRKYAYLHADKMDMEPIDTSNMCSHLQRKLFEKEGVYHPLWAALLEDPELTAVVRSRQLHIYRNGKKVLILAGKAAPKVIREDTICAFLPKV